MLRKNLSYLADAEKLVLFLTQCKGVAPNKISGAVIEVIRAEAKAEIGDADGDDLFDFPVRLAFFQIFAHQLGDTVSDAVKEIVFRLHLHFDQQQLFPAVLNQQVNPVEFIKAVFLITFTLQKINHCYILAQHCAEEAFQHREVGFVPQQLFDCPVKADQLFH